MTERPPIPVLDVLSAEYRTLRPDVDFSAEDTAELYRRAHTQSKPFSALCISGGGIRSATFALGAIQALAEHGLLEQFDYLSTVSGGGYIGGWLTAWVQRVKGIERVIPHLRRNAPPVADPDPDPIQHLREYNNYLTPKLGGLSPDTWTLGATIVRNVFLNWLVLIPILMFALMVPRLFLSLARYGELVQELQGSSTAVSSSFIVTWALPVAAAIFFCISMINTLRYLPAVGDADHTAGDFVRYVLTPLIVAVLAFTAYDSLYAVDPSLTRASLLDVITWTMAPPVVAWLLYLVFCRKSLAARWRLLIGPLSIAIALMGLITGLAAWLLTDYLLLSSWAVYTTTGPPLLLLGFSTAGAVFIGLSSRALQDEDREWLSRGAAYVTLLCGIWLAACAVVLIFPSWALSWPTWGKSMLATLGGAAAWLSSFTGYRGENTKAAETDPPATKALSAWILKLAPPMFIVLLATGLAILTNALLSATTALPTVWWQHGHVLENTQWFENLAWGAGFFVLSWVMARYININKFSLEGMYRDRLIRAYLGASNSKRKAKKFIGFCQSDNLFMRDLDTSLRPFHVVNTTLNLVGGDRLAWQQRKAESLTATALHCGNARLGYRPSAHYAGKSGISLGTAITISGAAASPSMGYHSSPVVGCIMTLFNLRLGAWLGNPGKAGNHTWTHEGPRSATKSLVREAFGLTSDASEYVYLSDGGHFENLGIYEMVLRRCHTIVVLDSGCDGQFTYEDLGNALRKIRIDMKIPIIFGEEAATALRSPDKEKRKRCATAVIQYSAADRGASDGRLIYIKPMLLGNEPPDVASYHCSFPAFPHQSTAEQWFDESQTESYRMLGEYSVEDILRGWDRAALLPDLPDHIETSYLGLTPGTALAKTKQASA